MHLNPESSALKTPGTGGIDISFESLSYQITQKDKSVRDILSNITGVFQAGKVNCIMGASGAGKTSLLNILACRIGNSGNIQVNGKIEANGKKYNQDNFNDFSAYVM